MTIETGKTATCHCVELEIQIDAPRESVWKALLEDTNLWFLPDFRCSGPDAQVVFDVSPGGKGLFEHASDGSWLHWFAVQMYLPSQYEIHLVGHIAPDWGGPTTSNLKLSVQEVDSGALLKVTDARHGHLDEQQTQSYADGWTQLFRDGLKAFVENA